MSPLNEIGGRLDQPDRVVFTAHTDAPVDRWPQIVLDGFNGSSWTSSATYRPLGTELPPAAAVTVAERTFQADITLGDAADGPWLPTQFRTVAVDGPRPAVDPATGTLLAADPSAVSSYTLRWSAPVPARDQLVGASVDRSVAGAVQLGEVPAGVEAVTRQAVGDAPPSFATALKLESWLRANYTVASRGRTAHRQRHRAAAGLPRPEQARHERAVRGGICADGPDRGDPRTARCRVPPARRRPGRGVRRPQR